MIPYNIYQTHKNIEFVNSNKKLLDATNSWKKYKDFTYKFYDDKKCDEFIMEYYPEIKEFYDKLPLNVMKADLWRYCVIYKYGGIYADVDTVLRINPYMLVNYKTKQLVVAPEDNVHFCQWVFRSSSKFSNIENYT